MTGNDAYKVLFELLQEEVGRLNEIIEVLTVRLNELEDAMKVKEYEVNELYKAVAELDFNN